MDGNPFLAASTMVKKSILTFCVTLLAYPSRKCHQALQRAVQRSCLLLIMNNSFFSGLRFKFLPQNSNCSFSAICHCAHLCFCSSLLLQVWIFTELYKSFHILCTFVFSIQFCFNRIFFGKLLIFF